MEYGVEDLKREIRIAIDQNMTSTQLSELGDVDTLSLDDIIESKVAPAARIVEQIAPAYLLDSGRAFAETISWKSQEGFGMGYVQLPDDFLRLVTFQMSDWDYAATVPITEQDPLYEQQHSRYPGIRGCPQKPIVALVQQPIGLVLEFYSCSAGSGVYVKRARYIPIPRIVDDKIELCEKLKPSIIYYAAYLTALSVGDKELAESMLNNSKEFLQ